MPWVLFTILAALLWTAVNIIDKFIISHEMRDHVLATVIAGISTFTLFGIVSLLFGSLAIPFATMVTALFAGVTFNLAILLYYSAMRKEEVSRFIPTLTTLTPLFVLLFAFVFLGETFGPITYGGIILLIGGVFLLSVRKFRMPALSSAFMVILAAAFLYAVRNIALESATLQVSIWSVFFWVGVGGGLVSVALFAVHHPHIRKRARKGIPHLLLSGTLSAVALFTFTFALSIGPVSLVSVLVETQMLFVFLAATIVSVLYPRFLKEKITRFVLLQKLAAILMILAGAVLIV